MARKIETKSQRQLKPKFVITAYLCWDHFEEVKQICLEPEEIGHIIACARNRCKRSASVVCDISLDTLLKVKA